METLPGLPGADGPRGDGRSPPARGPLHRADVRDPAEPRQAHGRMERGGTHGQPLARHPRTRVGEYPGLPRRHGKGLSDDRHAGRVLLFRHAPVARGGWTQLGRDLRRPKGLLVRPRGGRLQRGAAAPRRGAAGGLLERALLGPRARAARLSRLHALPARLCPGASGMERQRRRLGALLRGTAHETLSPDGGHGHPLPALPAPVSVPRRRLHGDCRRRVGDLLRARRPSGRGVPLHGSRPYRPTAPLPLLHAPRHGPQPLRGRPFLLPDDHPPGEDHLVDARKQPPAIRQRRELSGLLLHAARLPRGRLDSLLFRGAGPLP